MLAIRFRLVSPLPLALASLLCVCLLGAPGFAAKDDLKLTSVADFTKCADQYDDPSDVCLDALSRFVKAQPGQAFAAGKAVRAKMNHAAALPFFTAALAKKASRSQCADPDLQVALLAGLTMPPGHTASTSARTIVVDKCWNETQAPVLKALARAGSGSYFAENLCPTLAERKVQNPACETKPVAPSPPAAEPKWKALDPKTIQMDGPAKVYKGPQGETVVVAKVRNEDGYLLKFDRVPGEWNGRVVPHRMAPAGSGFDYFADLNGTRWVSIVVRDGQTELYPRGANGPIHLGYDESASMSASGQGLLDQLRKQK